MVGGRLLEALASSGFVVPTEQRAALEISLRLKHKEARLWAPVPLALWGRLLTSSSQDYLLARGLSDPISRLPEGRLLLPTKYYYSQDGVKWLDLQPVSEGTYELCKNIRGSFTGEPSHIYSVVQDVPQQTTAQESTEAQVQKDNSNNQQQDNKEQASEEGDRQEEVEVREDNEEELEGEEGDAQTSKVGLASTTIEIGELDRLSAFMRQVDFECGVIPKGAFIYNAKKELVRNLHFPGLKFPQDLDSYLHLFQNYEDSQLSKDVRGSWSVEVKSLEDFVVRSLLWPGYAFFYTNSTKEFGSLYFGFGEKNFDLPFMI